jgi:hypothetical protein
MDSALWLSKGKGTAGTQRPAGRRVPALMAPVFAVALIHFVCCKNSRERRMSGRKASRVNPTACKLSISVLEKSREAVRRCSD